MTSDTAGLLYLPAVAPVTVIWACLFTISYFTEIFSEIATEVGFENYAEGTVMVGSFAIMPFNCLVNVGYVIVGYQWLRRAERQQKKGLISLEDRQMFTIFSWMAILYAAVQFIRIVFQEHQLAVWDQWCTLPFFMWAVVWSRHVCAALQPYEAVILIAISIVSFGLTLVSTLGFEIALTIHIWLVVGSSLAALRDYANTETKRSFFLSACCCIGFVLLKVLDLPLQQYGSIFTILSGHFWSKVCDVLQIHYVSVFFLQITLLKKKRCAKNE